MCTNLCSVDEYYIVSCSFVILDFFFIVSVFVYVYAYEYRCPQNPEGGARTSGDGVPGSCELPHMDDGNQIWSSVTAEPSPQTCFCYFEVVLPCSQGWLDLP